MCHNARRETGEYGEFIDIPAVIEAIFFRRNVLSVVLCITNYARVRPIVSLINYSKCFLYHVQSLSLWGFSKIKTIVLNRRAIFHLSRKFRVFLLVVLLLALNYVFGCTL